MEIVATASLSDRKKLNVRFPRCVIASKDSLKSVCGIVIVFTCLPQISRSYRPRSCSKQIPGPGTQKKAEIGRWRRDASMTDDQLKIQHAIACYCNHESASSAAFGTDFQHRGFNKLQHSLPQRHFFIFDEVWFFVTCDIETCGFNGQLKNIQNIMAH